MCIGSCRDLLGVTGSYRELQGFRGTVLFKKSK